MTPVFKILVDDNYHFMDEDERYQSGEYSSADEAIQKCQQIVDEFLMGAYKSGTSAQELYESYTGFGEDPFIVTEDLTVKIDFSAWDYAKQRCTEITKKFPLPL